MQKPIKEYIHEAITSMLSEKLEVFSPVFTVEEPADSTHGDYASNVALVVAKEVGKAPREIAEILKDGLDGQIVDIASIDIAGPGFLNFSLTREAFVRALMHAHVSPEVWGKTQLFSHEQVLLEYTSPNLFKPLHIGNLVGNIIGESLARLYAFAGAHVVRLNYPSDIGLTVAKAVWGLREHALDPDDIKALGEAYRLGSTAYEEDTQAKESIDVINKILYAGSDADLVELRRRGIETSRTALDILLARIGTSFDGVIYESEVGEKGRALVHNHVTDGIFEESDGALVYKGEKVGLHTRVFVNSLGLPTYEAKDLGNMLTKHERYPEWTRMLIVTGGEQREYFKVLFAAAREVFPFTEGRTLSHFATGFLSLTTGKMSSRKGNVLTAETMLEDLRAAAHTHAAESRADDVEQLANDTAVAALKYQILRQSIGSDIVFDQERALSFEGASGPYLQYTHARTVSVLEKASGVGVVPAKDVVPEIPYAIERMLYHFDEVVAEATRHEEPHKIVTYLTELASAFNSFYGAEKIADNTDMYAPYKALITDAVRITLDQGLYLLGCAAPKKM